MTARDRARRMQALPTLVGLVGLVGAVTTAPSAHADNNYNGRLNNGVVVNVYTVQQKAGCKTELQVNPQLRLAAQWQTEDVLNNHDLDGDIGSDGSTVADRARNAGFTGNVA